MRRAARARRRRQYAVGAALVLAVALAPTPTIAKTAWPNPNAKVKETKSGHPEVLFTFDDGPDQKTTGILLDTLESYGVQAIFYSVGYLVKRRSKSLDERLALLDRIVRDGHLVGNHTVSHAHLCSVSPERAEQEIDEAGATLAALVRMPMFLFRAPYGDRCPTLEAMLESRNIVHDHWDVDAREWKNVSTASTTKVVIDKLKHLKGRAIILMHDTKIATVRAVPKILDWIEEENARRTESGNKTIRVLGASEWVAQNWNVSLWSVARDVSAAAVVRLRDSANRLLPGTVPLKSASADPR